ncbi:hypothetical protein [Bacillus altitudinis]|uniref:hypothetical protein n=1 Tax=Bacillus altitudinis TaxID=293387 RepID=UPI001C242F9D|nr:hypothetical protein [Bacillus altitudinis]MBU8855197.1 hypothetical protein [Bacillus sp. FJAT-26377]MCY7454252.1 hypothetical protein [Bacillus altitudinis]
MSLEYIKEKFMGNQFMKKKLFNMLKSDGQYISFNAQNGYQYNIDLQGTGFCIRITVAFKDLATLNILDAAVID